MQHFPGSALHALPTPRGNIRLASPASCQPPRPCPDKLRPFRATDA
ncbi:hypothetical protein LHK_01595 [Laribacter hongkongensis HLHK9]|uniref:Uncharacterized protein n=1 Tax=Laribacter hongkongensis (strain HLHK9) TaxID=557598 RepID=C1D7Z0_LARHH|nr:hypothetical protein LHK_01595 [Laribacter hongkongensis HLHK9]